MADLTIGTNGVSLVYADKAEIIDVIAVEAVTAGQPVYITTAGKAGVADANAAGKQQFRGIALKDTGAGKPCPVLKRGFLSGFALSGVAYNGPVYLSDTAGSLADAGAIDMSGPGTIVGTSGCTTAGSADGAEGCATAA